MGTQSFKDESFSFVHKFSMKNRLFIYLFICIVTFSWGWKWKCKNKNFPTKFTYTDSTPGSPQHSVHVPWERLLSAGWLIHSVLIWIHRDKCSSYLSHCVYYMNGWGHWVLSLNEIQRYDSVEMYEGRSLDSSWGWEFGGLAFVSILAVFWLSRLLIIGMKSDPFAAYFGQRKTHLDRKKLPGWHANWPTMVCFGF